ncbi:thioredoxin family protein [Phenylobacterium sp. J367]|uniref:DUF1223 domain-containing protein n=1 Tax=Phenylobacterium sp. J367 TaxID=2898435 RepID=UPI0021512747|nr:DUF1223 domain-containing protein [Phenylobacterium sp. J367]MCR5878231.1 DUF1223 domain-containing protein [Phenylobacterium sp. J367]
MRTAAALSLLLTLLPVAAAARPPVVVELFTAQGCGSCGEANAHAARLAERPGVLVLTYPVDYWDYLGWEDTFAEPAFAERQKAYVTRLKLREPYTPQVVVDGRNQVAGRQAAKVDQLVRDAARTPKDPPDIQFMSDRRVDVGSGRVPRGGAEVWLVRYDPREQEVAVKSGDNRGQSIVHRNVVREIERVGAWRGRPTAYRLPAPDEAGLATAIIVQAAKGGRILAVAQPKDE